MKDYAFRNPENEFNSPKIPAQIIGYGLAYDLFKQIEQNNNPVPETWKGLFNLTYTFGGYLVNGRLFQFKI